MNFTSELLETLENRTNEYCKAKFGKEPDSVELEDGQLLVIYTHYCCGDVDEESYYIDPEKLSDDLDKLYEERKAKEAEEARKREIERKRQEKIRAEREKRNRKAQYLQLKKEFGDSE